MASTAVRSSSTLEAWTGDLIASLPPAAGPLAPLQEQARAALLELPAPHRRQENWRFTDPALLASTSPRLLRPEQGAGTVSPHLRLRFDGSGDPLDGVTLPAGLEPIAGAELHQRLGSVLEATGCAHHWLTQLNQAAAEHVLALRVSGVAPPLELLLPAGASDGVLPLRVLLVLEEGAELELLQVHTASGASATSLVLEAHLGRGARLRHGLLAQGHPQASLLAQCVYAQESGSDLSVVSGCAGWGLLRLEPRVNQLDGAAHTSLRGLQRVIDRQIADTHSQVTFSGPDGQLQQVHKAVADGQARSVFNGAVRVPRQAQRTNASQISRNLLLSDRARIDTKPELEIVADDVRCAHGATVSRLQQDELFYLQSRGIAADQAARLLQRAFCEEVLRELPAMAAAWRPIDRLLGEA
ncbi:Fe-S cluster assembly protein SufD [Synechococcus sp. CS-1328]|nr:Fe-S cluster assembly protein SufD [Synechococcus sp. CS-1328]